MRGRHWCLGLLVGALCVLMGMHESFGAGFALYEGSARGNALGGTLVGRADDPSALFYNPAGITQLPGLQVMGGATVITPGTDVHIGDETHKTEDNAWIPPHFYATYQFSDSVWFGLGVFSPFGLGTEFEEDWPGKYNSYNAVIKTLTVNPNVAVKLNDRLSVAAGFEIMWFDLLLERKIRTGPPTPIPFVGDIDSSLDGDSFGYGVNVALHYRALDWLSLGFSYRSKVKQNVEGTADFTRPDVLGPLFSDTDASGSIMLPDMVFLGAAFYPMERLSIEIGGIWTRWSTYDALSITLDEPVAPGASPTTTVEKDWHDTWRFNVGVEYKATDWLDLRFAYNFDEEPIDDDHVDYLVPANDRHLFNVGPGFHWDDWTVDLSYTYIYITDRDVEARPEDFIYESEFEDGDAHLFGLSVSYKF